MNVVNKKNDIDCAVIAMHSGELACFPTETVYGIGADAKNYDAVEKIYKLKNRPQNNPLIIHCDSIEKIKNIAEFPLCAEKIAKEFWPGPISMVLKLKNKNIIAKNATAGLDTVCVRIPNNEIALKIIKHFDYIAAPSANISNYISPTEYTHVKSAFPDVVVIDGGKCVYGIESTIIDLSDDQKNPCILRHGFITSEILESFVGVKMNFQNSYNANTETTRQKSPGMQKKHYSPRAKLVKCSDFYSQIDRYDLSKIVTLCFSDVLNNVNSVHSLNLSDSGDIVEAAANFYSYMRALDDFCVDKKIDVIVVADIPNNGIGIAVNDKINRASVVEYSISLND